MKKTLLDGQQMVRAKTGKDMGDHPPITPMRSASTGDLSGDSWRLYEYVARHFIATVAPDCKYIRTRLVISLGATADDPGEFFVASGKIVEDPGVTEVLQGLAIKDGRMPELKQGENLPLSDVRLVSGRCECSGYHSFYQLLVGGPRELLRALQLKPASDYRSLAEGKSVHVDSIDDCADFEAVREAMNVLQLDEATQRHVWETVAGLLHLLSLQISEVSQDECALESSAGNKDVLERVKNMWQIDIELLAKELVTTQTKIVTGDTFVKKLRKAQAIDMRDALCKAIYERLFAFLVDRINDTINVVEGDTGPKTSEKTGWIGLLDIFGFEHFEKNSFEQLCINLANETLQNHYNTIIFTRDMQECREEGIDTASVVFYDNQPCLDLICGFDFSALAGKYANDAATHAPPTTRGLASYSIFNVLDEESLLGNGSDASFCSKICQRHGGTSKTMSSVAEAGHPNFIHPRTERNCFIIKHYAADVKYSVEMFREKNLDTLKDSFKELIRKSSEPFVAALFASSGTSATTSRMTVGTIYRTQLIRLMMELNATQPHWIRCVKPHRAKRPRMFNGVEVMTQLCSAGVLETVRIRKMSFSMRFTFDDFWRHFRLILRRKVLVGSEVASVVEILKACGVNKPELAQCGKTKVFLKTEAYHTVSRRHHAVRLELASRIAAFAHGRQSGWLLRCLQMQRYANRVQVALSALVSRRRHNVLLRNFQVKLITGFLYYRPSHRILRQLQLRERERELIKYHRDLILLQAEIGEDRARTVEQQEKEDFERIAKERAEHLEALIAAWKKRTEKKHATQRAAKEGEELASREEIVADEAVCLAMLRKLASLQVAETTARGRLAQEHLTARQGMMQAIEAEHLEILRELHRQRMHKIQSEMIAGEMEEESERARLSREGDGWFAVLNGLWSLPSEEAVDRDAVTEAEAAALEEIRKAVAVNLVFLEQRWRFQLDQQNKAAVLSLRREQHAARLALCAEEEQALVAALLALERSFEGAVRCEVAEAARQAEVRQQQRLAEKRAEARLQRARHEEHLRAAQEVWRRAQEKEQAARTAKFRREAELVERLWGVAERAEYFRQCERKESALAFPSNCKTCRVGSRPNLRDPLWPAGAPLAELQPEAASPQLAVSPGAPLLADISDDPASPPPRTAEASTPANPKHPRNEPPTVCPASPSLEALSRLRRLKHPNYRGFMGQGSADRRSSSPGDASAGRTVDPNESHRRRKEEMLHRIFGLEPFEPDAKAANTGEPVIPPVPRRIIAKSMNPFRPNWCPPSDTEAFLPDGSVVTVVVGAPPAETTARSQPGGAEAAAQRSSGGGDEVVAEAGGTPEGPLV